MKTMKSQEIRRVRDSFWLSKEHEYLPEVCLLTPSQETTTLFNQSGMQQLIPYLAGKEHKLGKRLYNIQKCVRTIDIDEVGDRSHLTFFDMMGNWSLGDYFKKESVERSREFLIKYLKIDPRKIAVTVFEGDSDAPRDEETANYRKKIGVPEDKISFLGAKDNWRSPGPIGPCGPDTEIFYRVGDKNGGPELPPEHSNVKDDDSNWMEIWNNVFMEYYRDDNGLLTKLKKQNVDTGMGFERMCLVLQNKNTIFETDLFVEIIETISKRTDLGYLGNEKRFRIVADHLRTACLMVQDGAISSNVGSGYILRMVIRRAYYNFVLLKDISEVGFDKFLLEIISIISKINSYRNLPEGKIFESISKETKNFRKTISRGLKILQDKFTQTNSKLLSGEDAFLLYDTYGFPIEITKEICDLKGRTIDIQTFDLEMEKARNRSRKATEKMFDKGIDWSKYLVGIPETIFIGYENVFLDVDDIKLLKDFDISGQRILIFDKTPFYAESGGQTGDIGKIVLNDGEEVQIINVIKYEGVFLHFVD